MTSARETPPPNPAGDGGGLPEGAEAPPPGVRAMAVLRWGIVVVVAAAAAGAWVQYGIAAQGRHQAASQYRCPMHPSVLQSVPGACPICGMDLVAVARAADVRATPASPHGATAAEMSGGRDPARTGTFWCPMHPEVASDDPAATCARCGGMRLVRRPIGSGAGVAVPGLTSVEIDPERVQLAGMRTAVARREKLGAELRTVGFVTADESRVTVVTARVTGWIDRVQAVRTGQRVARNQVLATVSSPELLAAQQAYVSTLHVRATRPGPRPSDLARRKLEQLGVAPEEIEALTGTGQPIELMPLRSPAAGFVARKSAVAGSYVQPGTELFQIADLSTVSVVVDVFEPDASRLRAAQPARFSPAAHPGEAFAGRVELVYPAVNPDTRTLQARIDLRNDHLRLRPGMRGDVVLDLPATDAVTVPREAVVDTGELQYVFLARDGGRFEPRRVKVGARAGERVQVLGGVAEGDRVVTTASFLVDSESRLRAALESFGPAGSRPDVEVARENPRDAPRR